MKLKKYWGDIEVCLEFDRCESKYSVLMSLYKNENADNFRTAIYSMISQTCPPDEIVLVEDGPLTDSLYAVINELEERYSHLISLVVNEKNQGLGKSLQKGLKKAKNELVARMDTDDIAVSDRCRKQLIFMEEHRDVAIVGGQIEEFVENEKNIVGKRKVPLSDDELKKYTRKRCPFNHMTVMFRRSDVMEVGNYQDWFWNEDYYLWIRMMIAGKKFANLSETLVKVRVGSDMYKRRGGLKYFISEKKIQKLMLSNHIIGYFRYSINISERFILQVLLPNWLRGIVFKKIARK